MKKIVFEYIDTHREKMIELWREVVSIESGSGNKAGVDAVAARFRQVIEQTGGLTRVIEMNNAGNMLIGEFAGAKKDDGVAFMGHMDTVFPDGTVAKRPFTISDG